MRLSIPTERTFNFISFDGGGFTDIRRMTEEDKFDPETCFTISFRQGTRTESDQRMALMNKRTYKVDRDDGDLLQLDDFNPDELSKSEIFMTMSGTDLEYPVITKKTGGDEVVYKALRFETKGSIKCVASRKEFELWWGPILDQWAREIYKACLEVNPKWDLSKSDQ